MLRGPQINGQIVEERISELRLLLRQMEQLSSLSMSGVFQNRSFQRCFPVPLTMDTLEVVKSISQDRVQNRNVEQVPQIQEDDLVPHLQQIMEVVEASLLECVQQPTVGQTVGAAVARCAAIVEVIQRIPQASEHKNRRPFKLVKALPHGRGSQRAVEQRRSWQKFFVVFVVILSG